MMMELSWPHRSEALHKQPFPKINLRRTQQSKSGEIVRRGALPRTPEPDTILVLDRIGDGWANVSKLGKREIKALKFLAAIGPNIKVHWRDVKDCGPDTEDRLKIRGFLKTFSQEKYPDRIGYYMLTDAGLEAFNEIS
jgi:hypothetical protein